MKNIHLLPTRWPKPRFDKYLVLNKESKPCIWNTETMGSQNTLISQNIYITADEEIKEGDWILFQGVLTKALKGEKFSGKEKVILTTDPDLIKDGVQAIDDEFLEWFVKNPSCEFVEVSENPFYEESDYQYYKIIIPKEEPKQETLETDKTNWKAVYEDSLNMQKCSNAGYESKIQELKQEIEKMYSEKEVLDLLLTWKYTEHGLLSTKEWFEQFKKK